MKRTASELRENTTLTGEELSINFNFDDLDFSFDDFEIDLDIDLDFLNEQRANREKRKENAKRTKPRESREKSS